ncbi:stalk domain-containing protein [Bacillus sp. Marseille-P3661]|uniref:stalk domain-containing protein n=1 Tax=Bacillus sp. Marseille-P3661 TaxID=1936234 RepID=UPI000C854CE7|nr:stalk domain-containing protein [Bacillus sp. Marseille-P3661]
MGNITWKKAIVTGVLSLSICFQSSMVDAAFKPANVKTIAGSGELGYQDGSASLAKFNSPTVAVEGSNGTYYIVDTHNHRIRVVNANNQVSTFAGVTTENDEYGFAVGGFKDGAASTAMFNLPKGLARSNEGILYVADSGNNAIRAIDTNGTVSTVMKDLQGPSDVVISQTGELIVSDTLNHRIVKITEQGGVSVIAGGGYSKDGDWLVGGYADGNGQAAKFNEPTGLAVSKSGEIYVADTGNQRIRKISADGTVTTVAGSGSEKIGDFGYIAGGFADGDAKQAQFNFPTGLAFDTNGNLYVADSLNHVVRVITSAGEVQTVAGIAGESGNKVGPESKAQFHRPSDVTVLTNGELLIADEMNNKVRMIDWFELPASFVKGNKNIEVVFNNNPVVFSDAKPKIINNRTMIPLRAVTETFGYKVDWNEVTKGITIQNGEQIIELTVGETTVKGTNTFAMDVAPEVEKSTNRTYVPIRFIAEAFNYQVDWLGVEQVVLIR